MGFGTGFFLGVMASSSRGPDADPAGCLFGLEMTLISSTLGILYESWWVFFLSVTALYILVRIKYFLLPLLVILTGFWGLGAYSGIVFPNLFNNNSKTIVGIGFTDRFAPSDTNVGSRPYRTGHINRFGTYFLDETRICQPINYSMAVVSA